MILMVTVRLPVVISNEAKDILLNIFGVSSEGDLGSLEGFGDTHRQLSSWPSWSALKGKKNDNVIIPSDV